MIYLTVLPYELMEYVAGFYGTPTYSFLPILICNRDMLLHIINMVEDKRRILPTEVMLEHEARVQRSTKAFGYKFFDRLEVFFPYYVLEHLLDDAISRCDLDQLRWVWKHDHTIGMDVTDRYDQSIIEALRRNKDGNVNNCINVMGELLANKCPMDIFAVHTAIINNLPDVLFWLLANHFPSNDIYRQFKHVHIRTLVDAISFHRMIGIVVSQGRLLFDSSGLYGYSAFRTHFPNLSVFTVEEIIFVFGIKVYPPLPPNIRTADEGNCVTTRVRTIY